MGWALMGLLEARMAQKRGKTAQLTYALKVSTSNGAQFEDPQGQDFEEFPEQQQFANEEQDICPEFPEDIGEF
jgi:hypothetical protein